MGKSNGPSRSARNRTSDRAPAGAPRKSRPKRRAPSGGGIPAEGRARVVIENVYPEVNGGRFPIKRVEGERVDVEADIFSDGHEVLAAVIRHCHDGDGVWDEAHMEHVVNDRWRGSFRVGGLGRHRYVLQAWIDRFGSCREKLDKKLAASQDVSVDLLDGAALIIEAAKRADGEDAEVLHRWAEELEAGVDGIAIRAVGDEHLAELMRRHDERPFAVSSRLELEVVVDPERARHGAWYELFPRSASPEPGRHGTFDDVIARLPSIAGMGFDVLYLPPIHPIGRSFRKGRNNTEAAEPGDVGSPWAIGGPEGGHTAIHPDLGTFDDFDRLVAAAREHGMDLALDIAFQCTPDHPWVAEHPEWFRHRADGTIAYAENPPKKYQDIYPMDFENPNWRERWEALRDVFRFWAAHGVRIFRVDNPHTKPFAFWEWCINDLKATDPDLIFLSEAFTRPRVMERLAKLGFTQSYTYFTWRRHKWELQEYFSELNHTLVREYLRPSLWPNTPDILTDELQYGGRPAFMERFLLAATLGANYGIYGPAFELLQHQAVEEGKEESLNSEKYEIREWDLEHPESLRPLIARVNRIRRENPALQRDHTLRFHGVDNDALLAYSKTSPDGSNVILCVINLDHHHTAAGTTWLDLDALGLVHDEPFEVHDLITDAHYTWHGPNNYVELDPHVIPGHILRVRQHARTEQDFEYFL